MEIKENRGKPLKKQENKKNLIFYYLKRALNRLFNEWGVPPGPLDVQKRKQQSRDGLNPRYADPR